MNNDNELQGDIQKSSKRIPLNAMASRYNSLYRILVSIKTEKATLAWITEYFQEILVSKDALCANFLGIRDYDGTETKILRLNVLNEN